MSTLMYSVVVGLLCEQTREPPELRRTHQLEASSGIKNQFNSPGEVVKENSQ